MANKTETKEKKPKVEAVKKIEKKVVKKNVDTNKYAVIRLSGRQYLVKEGKEVLVDKLTDTKKIEPEVLLVVDGDDVKVGKPVVSGAKVKVSVVAEVEKGKKVRIFKYKSKSRYRKTLGFRPQHTRLLVEKISK